MDLKSVHFCQIIVFLRSEKFDHDKSIHAPPSIWSIFCTMQQKNVNKNNLKKPNNPICISIIH